MSLFMAGTRWPLKIPSNADYPGITASVSKGTAVIYLDFDNIAPQHFSLKLEEDEFDERAV